ncbi:hypothetical protein C1H46_015663 [Malus baccata]|uniref:Uncharacterized protein n=1 Tax=Malus baccata TaxID=106549 RepID=A0A540MJ23_MALBA|nr:hypothetical protein C1H46_015663 [Malus baccata]
MTPQITSFPDSDTFTGDFELMSVPWNRQWNCYNISDPAIHWKTKQEMLGSKAKGIISDSLFFDMFLHVLDQ